MIFNMKFSNIRELQKAYTEGIYSDSPLNRKLGRVGMTYTAYAEYTQIRIKHKVITSPELNCPKLCRQHKKTGLW